MGIIQGIILGGVIKGFFFEISRASSLKLLPTNTLNRIGGKFFRFFHSLVLGPLHFTSPVKLYHVWIVNSSSESENNDQNSLLPPSENFARSAALLDLLYKVYYSAHERTDTRGREGGASSGTWGSRVLADPALFLTLYCATSYITTTCSSTTTTMKSGPKKQS